MQVLPKNAQMLETTLEALLDDPEFHELDGRLGRFNLFEALGGVRGELRHSNFLSFIFSPARTHGLGSLVLERTLRAILETLPIVDRPVRTLELALGDLDDAVVHRERDNIDLLIEIPSLNLVVTIENKVGASAGVGQLARYRDLVEGRFATQKHLLVFLTPEGIDPDCAGWIPFSYRQLASTLDDIVLISIISYEAKFLLCHYVEMLRRHVVPDDGLRDLAMRLYEKHREAFDFVFDVRPQPRGLLDDLSGRILSMRGLIEDRSGANLFRFVPEHWDEKLSHFRCNPEKWTRTGRGLVFEAKLNPTTGRVHVILVLGPCDSSLRKALYDRAAARPSVFKGLVKPMGTVTATIYSRELITATQAQDLDFEQQIQLVSFAWSDFQGRELGSLMAEVEAIAQELAPGTAG